MITVSGTRKVNMLERLLNIRNRHFLALDIILLALAPPAALALRAGKAFAPCCPMAMALILYLAVALTVRPRTFYRMGMHLPGCLDEAIAELVSAARQDDRQGMLARLPALIPEFQPVLS
ncbi:MAG: hypothetical protein GY759_24005 [Chloroflexi bacterium]|nr:hypothetical protein [Chloroflexota bacterium]